jgi:acyl transferase domain-containing protein
MHPRGSAVVFAGQGALLASPFTVGHMAAEFQRVVDDLGPLGSRCRMPEGVALLVFAASVAHYRALRARGERPSVLVGHGMGELIAIVCAGALTVQQGAQIVVQRRSVLDRCHQARGAMLSAATNRTAADRLVALAGASRAAVAADNGPGEVVIAGTIAGIDAVRRSARQRGIETARLNARWPLHCAPLMLPAAIELAEELWSLQSRPFEVPVFSPAMGRYYRESDKLGECLAAQLAVPVQFTLAIRTLISAGIESFVECGPLHGLGRHIQELAAKLDGDGEAPSTVEQHGCALMRR